jgi:hypothetical protein
LKRVVGLAYQLVEQIVLCESNLQHAGFESREVANARLKRPMNSPCLPWLKLHFDPSMDRIPKSGQAYRSATIAEG